jgi:predicted P-loop ATPase
VSEQFDEYRDPFAREMKVHQRRFVFGMTENNMHPFGDPSGARRYWPVDVEHTVNFKWIEENRDQLFAEAWYKAKKGEAFIAIPKELTDEIQEMHREHDIWEEKVIEFLITQKDFSKAGVEYVVKPSTIFKDGFDMDLEKVEQRQERRLGNCLRAIGFTPVTKRIDGKVSRVWLIKQGNIDRIIRNLSDADLKTLKEHVGTPTQQFNAF